MKYVLIICDGLSDGPVCLMNKETPMSAAVKPVTDGLAAKGRMGLVRLSGSFDPPERIKAVMTLLGSQYCETGHIDTAFEAIAAGVEFDDDDIVFKCTPVVLSDEKEFEEKTMTQFCGILSAEETDRILSVLNEYTINDIFRFYRGADNALFLVWRNGEPEPGIFVSPEEVCGSKIGEYLPKGDFTPVLIDIMKKAAKVLKSDFSVNGIWLWGECKKPCLMPFSERCSLKTAMISSDPVMQGFGISVGLDVVDIDADADTVISCFDKGEEFVCIHYSLVGKSDNSENDETESVVSDRFSKKVSFLESLDKNLISPLISDLRNKGEDFALAFVSSVSASCETGCMTSEAVPYMIYRSNDEVEGNSGCFNEKNAFDSGIYHAFGYDRRAAGSLNFVSAFLSNLEFL